MDSESGFMLAAEKAIADLQAQVEETKAAAEQAKIDAVSVARSAKRWKILTVVLMLLVISTGYLWIGQRSATSQLRQQAVNSCVVGNERAAGVVTALNELVDLLEGPHPTAAIREEAAKYKVFVVQHNKTRNCPKAYGS